MDKNVLGIFTIWKKKNINFVQILNFYKDFYELLKKEKLKRKEDELIILK